MPTYPYISAGTWAAGQVLTSAEVTIINANAAAAADGSLWTDFAIARNWIGTSTLATYGNVVHFVERYEHSWISLGVSGGNPIAAMKFTGDSAFTAIGAIGAGDGLTPTCAASNTAITVVGGTPGIASNKKFRTNAGDLLSWSVRTSNAAGTESVRGLCWHSGASLFIAGLSNTAATNIETSTDGITWTQITGLANTNPRGAMASNGTTAVILPYNTSTNKCLTTANGTTYTERTLPHTEIWYSVVWDSTYSRFIAFGATNVAYSSDGATWSSAGALDSIRQCAAVGRVLVGGSVGLTVVSAGALIGTDYTERITFLTSGTIMSVASGNKQFMVSTSTGVHYWSLAGGSIL